MAIRGAKRVGPQIIQGMTLRNVLEVLARHDFQIDASCLGRLAHLLALGIFNSVYGGCETFFNAREISKVQIEHPPLFVLGHWRSGTTHLHNLLSHDPNFAFPTAYQALFPNHFIFSQVGGPLFDRLAPRKRPMDNMAFSSLVPHEDEFALVAHSTISPYMRFIFPVTGADGYSKFDPCELPPEALERWKKSFTMFLKKVTLSEGKRIVLKSPPHMARLRTLLELFPKAQFIHIVRDPYMVYLSTRKLWADSLAFAWLQAPSPEQLDETILSSYCELFTLFHRDRSLIPDGALHEMKFEDLEADPMGTLKKLYERFDLGGFDQFEARVCPYLEKIKKYEKNHYSLDEVSRRKVALRWRSTFDRYGYPV
ncbi:MAG: sulfotransferase [Desulfomonile tiedjei]|nr:sulfotransferase [Desulfomonile tiedjei]